MGKKQGRRGRWEGGYLFPLPVVPRALSFSPLPATNRGLCREEKDTELKHVVHTYTNLNTVLLHENAKK